MHERPCNDGDGEDAGYQQGEAGYPAYLNAFLPADREGEAEGDCKHEGAAVFRCDKSVEQGGEEAVHAIRDDDDRGDGYEYLIAAGRFGSRPVEELPK